MIMTVKVTTPEGLYAEHTIEVYNMKAGLKMVLPILENLPDKQAGMELMDWNTTTVTFEDRPWKRKITPTP